jgi:predicted TIM-barrel enzyme
VFVNTGAKSTNVAEFLTVADGAIVGSDLKVDGGTWNPVDPERVARFMEAARA